MVLKRQLVPRPVEDRQKSLLRLITITVRLFVIAVIFLIFVTFDVETALLLATKESFPTL